MTDMRRSMAADTRRLGLVLLTAALAAVTLGATAAGPADAAPHRHHGHHHHGQGHHHHGHHHTRKHHGRTRGETKTLESGTTTSSRSTSNAGSSVPARSAQEAKIGKALLAMLNRERSANHLPALTMESHLLLSARRHDLAMARSDDMSHQVAGESSLGTRVTRAGYNWTWTGENIGWNSDMSQQGVLELEQLMYNEKAPNDGHRQNILSTHYSNIGVDVYFDQAHQKVWLTTDFGHH